jgi:hypothetical protein
MFTRCTESHINKTEAKETSLTAYVYAHVYLAHDVARMLCTEVKTTTRLLKARAVTHKHTHTHTHKTVPTCSYSSKSEQFSLLKQFEDKGSNNSTDTNLLPIKEHSAITD